MIKMHKYNSIPADAIKINYTNKDFDDFFTYQFEKLEHRQVYYKCNDTRNRFLDLEIFWIDEINGLGFGLLNNNNENLVQAYRFGSNEAWHKFKMEFALQFAKDDF